MKLSKEELQIVAHRARLALTEEEIEQYCADLGALEELSAALLPYSEPMLETDVPHGLEEMRADEVRPSFPREEMLGQAPVREGEYIVVPCAVEAP